MRISDWSSDVCSSDLAQEFDHGRLVRAGAALAQRHQVEPLEPAEQVAHELDLLAAEHEVAAVGGVVDLVEGAAAGGALVQIGRESWRARGCQSGSFRGSPYT